MFAERFYQSVEGKENRTAFCACGMFDVERRLGSPELCVAHCRSRKERRWPHCRGLPLEEQKGREEQSVEDSRWRAREAAHAGCATRELSILAVQRSAGTELARCVTQMEGLAC